MPMCWPLMEDNHSIYVISYCNSAKYPQREYVGSFIQHIIVKKKTGNGYRREKNAYLHKPNSARFVVKRHICNGYVGGAMSGAKRC